MAARPAFPVAIIGPGALGLLYASRLARVVRVALVARDAARARELRAGVRVGGRLYRPEVFSPDALPHADLAIVLVKSYDTLAAVRLARRMHAKRALSLQNGLVRGLAQGVSTAGAYRRGDGVAVVATGETLLPRGFEAVAALLRSAGLTARVVADIDAVRHRKLLANVCINPLTALFHIRNGELAQARYRPLVEALAREAALALRIPPRPAIAYVMKVAAATARNRSSMLQDIEAGRRTEIGELTGAMLHIAARRRVDAPTHRAMLRLISVIERA
jgi:2-dehydropantoate 2-reductase